MKDLCERYDASTLQQLYKIITDDENGGLKNKNVFPVALVQSVFDGLTGTRLDQILALNNCIYLPYKGTSEATRLSVKSDMRRKGLIVTFRDLDNYTWTQRYKGEDSISDAAWQDDANWEAWDFNSLLEDVKNVIEDIFNNIEEYPELIKYINNYIDTKAGYKTEVVTALPVIGAKGTIYLMKNAESTETDNSYDEFIWVDSIQDYEQLGSFSVTIDLSGYLTKSEFNDFKGKFTFSGTGSKFLNDKGEYEEVVTDIQQATSSTLGGIKIGYSSTANNRAVQLDSNSKAYVNVPDATTTAAGVMTAEDKTKLDGLTGAYVQILTQDEYDVLESKDENTIYYIKG